MKLFLRLGLWFLVVLACKGAFADPPKASHSYWQNSNYNGHYVLYDNATRTYIETVNCKAAWRFTVASDALNTLTLFDASRGMTIRLTYDGMYLKEKGATGFSFYQKGSFDTRTQFKHYDASGYTGALTKQHGCGWVEYLAGSKSADWRFKELGRNASYVDLYDSSRNMLVRLNKDSMYLRTGSNPLAFFKKGNW